MPVQKLNKGGPVEIGGRGLGGIKKKSAIISIVWETDTLVKRDFTSKLFRFKDRFSSLRHLYIIYKSNVLGVFEVPI